MAQEFDEIVARLVAGNRLSRDQTRRAMLHIMSGTATDLEIRDFLVNIPCEQASVEELVGAALVMREKVIAIDTDGIETFDSCGTGGDRLHTFNISTTAALLAASCGVKVVKHGNRSASGRAGSADVLEKLGVGIDVSQPRLKECLREANICFAFASALHPAMKHVRGVRRSLGVPTIFNILGPLTNPGGATLQLVGVFSADLTDKIASVLRETGSRRVWVVHAADGLDEISTVGPTRISELKDGVIHTWMLNPIDFGFAPAKIADLQIADLEDAATSLLGVLNGEAGPKRDIAVINAAAALLIAEKAADLKTAMKVVEHAIASGAARRTLDDLIRLTQN